MIEARLERACAQRVIFAYTLPKAVDEALLQILFPGERVRVHAFSQVVDGAQDLGRVTTPCIDATAALGGSRLVVAYMRASDGSLPMRDVEMLEEKLAQTLGVSLRRSQ